MRTLTPLFALLTACQSVWTGTADNYRDFLTAHPPDHLTVTFFEVHDGDGFLVEFPGGGTMLVDSGDGRHVENILNYLSERGIGRIDAALVTHPHLDHYGGMIAVLERHPFGQFLSNGRGDTLGVWDRLDEALTRRGVPRRVLRRGDVIEDFEDVTLEVLSPDEAALAAAARGDENHGSIVLRMTYGDTVFLLMGDAEREEEARLIAQEGDEAGCDVLKLGHHGSPDSGSEEWLAATHPKVAVCPGTGLPSRPDERLRKRLSKAGVRLFEPERDGAVQIISDGEQLRTTSFSDTFRAP